MNQVNSKKKSLLFRLISLMLFVLSIPILCFIYVYLCAINPIGLLTFCFFCFFLGVLFFIPFFMAMIIWVNVEEGIRNNKFLFLSIVISLLTSLSSSYIVVSMESSIFYTSVMEEISDNKSHWIPTVSSKDIKETLLSTDVLLQKIDFMDKNTAYSVIYKGRESGGIGSIKNIFRFIEIGILLIGPIILSFIMRREDI